MKKSQISKQITRKANLNVSRKNSIKAALENIKNDEHLSPKAKIKVEKYLNK